MVSIPRHILPETTLFVCVRSASICLTSVGPSSSPTPKRPFFLHPGGYLPHQHKEALAVLVRQDRKQRHGEGINDVVVRIDLDRVDNWECSLIMHHLARVRCGLLEKGTSPVEQGSKSERRFVVKCGQHGSCVAFEQCVNIGASGQE